MNLDIPEHVQQEQIEQAERQQIITRLAIDIYGQLLAGRIEYTLKDLRKAAKAAFSAAEIFREEHNERYE